MKYSVGFEFIDQYNNIKHKVVKIVSDYYECEYKSGEGCHTLMITKCLSEKYIDECVERQILTELGF